MLSSLRHEQDADGAVSNAKFPHSSRIYMATEEFKDRQQVSLHFQYSKQGIKTHSSH